MTEEVCTNLVAAVEELCEGTGPDDVDPDLTARDLTLRAHSWRNFEPWEVLIAAKNDGKRTVRAEVWPFIEDGRFEPALKEGHRFFTPLDPDERADFYLRNPDYMDWVSVWGYTEDLVSFQDHRPDAILSPSPFEIAGIEVPGVAAGPP